MNHLEINDLVSRSVRGAIQVIPTKRGVTASRLPSWTYLQHSHAPIVAKMAERLSGVRLEVETSATSIKVTYRSIRDTNLANGWMAAPSTICLTSDDFEESVSHSNGDLRVWNGEEIIEFREGNDSIAVFSLPKAEGSRLLSIWLPHNCPVEVIDILGDAPIRPAPISIKPKWVHYGSSISHCEEADSPVGVWPVAASRMLGLELYNLGLGGCANLEQFAARTIKDLPADLISLKIGINVVNGANHTARTFQPAVHGFIDTIREGHPDTPILVISPVCCPAHENNPGPSQTDGQGMVKGQALGAQSWVGELTLVSIRETLSELVAARSKTDSNIYFLNGLILFNEIDALTMPDGIHPDADGYRKIAQNFVVHVPKPWNAASKKSH